MALAGAAMFFLPHVRRQMRAEIRAQFEAFRATGLKLDHVTAHKHFHLHPSILSAVIELVKEFGAPAVRAPMEPEGVLARIDGARPGLTASALAPLAHVQRARLRRAGVATPDQVFGLAWSGAMTQSRLRGAHRAFAGGGHRNLHASGDLFGLRGSSARLSLPGRTRRADFTRSSPPNLRFWRRFRRLRGRRKLQPSVNSRGGRRRRLPWRCLLKDSRAADRHFPSPFLAISTACGAISGHVSGL